ncbi:SusD/RagB family nutrient-binding outer membrane lipoprotein [Lutibacter sp. B1]|uniref:SusD/RagB family nutrient-binding outer membrane lipoprotein n=1 Tax=Lutibacter sp. B1 TaxID=2725996 RepID=UPI001456EC79|nr:SusD/RagB family nutrient-binding outer membrane lipoprotein [Lutibacter sp. B1]NLP58773.1 SusD/RagB family nutrient-binding outer membrane lipoprotein [Lutibacter sp. B1]
MKKINNLIKLMLFCGAFIFSSCETTELDLTENPNALTPSQANPDFFLNSIQEDFARFVESFGATGAEVTRIDHMSGRDYTNAYSPTDFDSEWTSAYKGMMEDIRLMNILAEESELSYHIGMGQVFQAYIMITLVDFFGDVPYTEALLGSENLNPKADSSESIYTTAISLLDNAIKNFNSKAAAEPQYDFYYDGNWELWIKAANTIKMKAYITTRLVDDSAVNNFKNIVNSGNYISSISEDFQFTWGTNEIQPDTRHPRYVGSYTSTGGEDYMSNWFMNELLSTNDPRRFYYFYRQNEFTPGSEAEPDEEKLDCSLYTAPAHYDGYTYCTLPNGYWGRDHGNDAGIPPDGFERTLVGVYPAGGAFDDSSFEAKVNGDGRGGDGITPVMLSSWVDFMIAEIKVLVDKNESAGKDYFLNGIEKSVSKVISFADSGSEEEEANIQSHMLDMEGAYDDASDKMEVVASQYFIALYGNGIDAYNFYRRVGYPTSLQPNIEPNPGGFIRSFFYPANYANTNSNSKQKNGVDVQVFWDTNPSSPGFPIAN